MAPPERIESEEIDAWLAAHPAWRWSSGAIVREFDFPDFAQALAFAVRVGEIAAAHDHHPDLEIRWGRASVRWTTHDAGGVTGLDLAAAEATERSAS